MDSRQPTKQCAVTDKTQLFIDGHTKVVNNNGWIFCLVFDFYSPNSAVIEDYKLALTTLETETSLLPLGSLVWSYLTLRIPLFSPWTQYGPHNNALHQPLQLLLATVPLRLHPQHCLRLYHL